MTVAALEMPTGPLSLKVSGYLGRGTWLDKRMGTILAATRKAQAQGLLDPSPICVLSKPSPSHCSGLNLAWVLSGAREDQTSPHSRYFRLREVWIYDSVYQGPRWA